MMTCSAISSRYHCSVHMYISCIPVLRRRPGTSVAHADLRTQFIVPKSVTAAINARDASGAPPLFFAVRCGAKGALRELAKSGADVAILDNNRSSTCRSPVNSL